MKVWRATVLIDGDVQRVYNYTYDSDGWGEVLSRPTYLKSAFGGYWYPVEVVEDDDGNMVAT